MCDYVKILLEYNKGRSDHIITYKIGKITCKHLNNTSCVQLDTDHLPLTKSAHSEEKYAYYIHPSRIDTMPYIKDNILANIRTKMSKIQFYITESVHTTDVKYIRKYHHHPTKIYTYSEIEQKDILSLLDKNVRVGYINYNGNTKFNQIHFEKSTHAYLQMHGSLIGTFKFTDRDEPPPSNSIICGIVGERQNSRYFTHWFHCSKQFYILYLLIMNGKNHEVFKGKNRNQIMEMLETNKSLKVVECSDIKSKNYVHLDIEPSAIEYCDIYKSIADIFYFQNDIPLDLRKIPEYYRIPVHSDIYKQSLIEAFG